MTRVVAPRRSAELAVFVVVALLLAVLFCARLPLLVLVTDSNQYLTFAKALSGGEVFSGERAQFAMMIRTPVYPGLLAAAHAVTGEWGSSVVVVHFAMGLAAAWLIFRCALPMMPLWAAAGLAVIGPAIGSEMLRWILSEWTAFCFLLALLTFVVTFARTRGTAALVALAWASTLLVLTRPVFVFLLPAPYIAALLSARRARAIGFAATSLLPLALWAGLNTWRIGEPTLSELGSGNLFAVAALFGDAPPAPGDTPEFEQFRSAANARRQPLSRAEVDELPQRGLAAFIAVCHNLDLVDALHEKLGLSWMTIFASARNFGWRVLREHPGDYAHYVYRNLLALVDDGWLLLGATIAIVCSAVRRKAAPAAVGAAFAIAVHLGYLGLVSLLSVTTSRYSELSGSVLSFAAIWLVYALLLSFRPNASR